MEYVNGSWKDDHTKINTTRNEEHHVRNHYVKVKSKRTMFDLPSCKNIKALASSFLPLTSIFWNFMCCPTPPIPPTFLFWTLQNQTGSSPWSNPHRDGADPIPSYNRDLFTLASNTLPQLLYGNWESWWIEALLMFLANISNVCNSWYDFG